MDAKEARIYLAIIISVIVVGVIIIYFAISVVRYQRRTLELQKANALAEISAMEEERARIAADLHDELGPILSVIKFRVDHVGSANKDEQGELTRASQQLDDVITKMREVSINLMPVALKRKGLKAAIEEFISQAAESGGIDIQLRAEEIPVLQENVIINLYRIVQETVHNCIKHAEASKMEILFETRQGLLTLICRDNGKGFVPPQAGKPYEGIGLRSLRNRTEMMDGTMVANSKPGKGSILIFEIPLK